MKGMIWRLGLSVAAITLGGALYLVGASGPASAAAPSGPGVSASQTSPSAPPPPTSGNHCSGDACIRIQSPTLTNNTVRITAWAYDAKFKGHFQLHGKTYTENTGLGTTTWPAGGGQTSDVRATWLITDQTKHEGTFCVTAWKELSPGHWTDIGHACADLES